MATREIDKGNNEQIEIGLSSKEKKIIEEGETKRKQALTLKEKTHEDLKKLVVQGFHQNKNVNQIWKANFSKDQKAIKSKMYRIQDELAKEGITRKTILDKTGQKIRTEPSKIKPASFKPTIKLKKPIEPKGAEIPTTEEGMGEPSEEYPMVSIEEAEFLSYYLPDGIGKLVDARYELSPELRDRGAKLHKAILNAHPTVINKFVFVPALLGYWFKVVFDIITGVRKLKALDAKETDDTVAKTEKKIKKAIKDEDGYGDAIKVKVQ